MPSRFVFSFPEIDLMDLNIKFLKSFYRVEDIIHDDSD